MAETNGNNGKLAQAVESIGAKTFTRIATPILLAIITYLGVEVRADIHTTLDKLNAATVQIAVLQIKVETLEKEAKK